MSPLSDVVIREDQRGQRLDQAIATATGLSRSQVQRHIREGRVLVNGSSATRVSEPVAGGERVLVSVPDPAPATPRPQALPLAVVYEDRDLIVIDKPSGMVVHPGAGHAEGTLVNALLHHVTDLSGIGGTLRPGIVHRLDKGTSGVMVIAKHDRAHQELTRQFSDRRVEKTYMALVWGVLRTEQHIDVAIGRDPGNRQKMSVRARRGRSAVTHVVPVERLRGVTLVNLTIATGRTHQIRVHLQSIGHPVVGDSIYGGTRRQLPADLRLLASLERPFLHAARLAFTHPADGRPVAFESPLPSDLENMLEALRKTALT